MNGSRVRWHPIRKTILPPSRVAADQIMVGMSEQTGKRLTSQLFASWFALCEGERAKIPKPSVILRPEIANAERRQFKDRNPI